MTTRIKQPAQAAMYPYDEGRIAASMGASVHTNPYKYPNAVKTDAVKSEAWLRGFGDFSTTGAPI